MLERNLTVASVEKRDDKYGIWPEMSTPFSLPCILFGDRKPQRGDSIVIECEGDNIVGALWNGTRILGPARPYAGSKPQQDRMLTKHAVFRALKPAAKSY